MATGKIYGVSISGSFAWWLWRTIYLSKLLSVSKKLKVALDWTVNSFLPRDTSELYRP
jgi:NADH dehydrogenase